MNNREKLKEIYLYGGGGHGKVIIDIIETCFGREALKGIFDDEPKKKGSLFYGSKIIGSIDEFHGSIPNLIIAIGDNATRKEKALKVQSIIGEFATIIHPSAVISPSATIGEGTVVMPGAIINADAQIGRHCIINSGAIIEHDCIVDDYSHIAPNTILTGGVKIGKLTLVGANSVVVPYRSVGDNCLIGAGSVVTKQIPDNAIVRGNPARIIKIKSH